MSEQATRYPWALRVEHWGADHEHPGWPSRATWGPGPWQDEPDLIEWRRAGSGLPCLIVRGGSGTLCGYVGLPPTHRHFAQHYDAVPDEVAHGGLTFSGLCGGHICHVPKDGESPDGWWVGFDCGHFEDLSPGLAAITRQMRADNAQRYRDLGLGELAESGSYSFETYRDVDYVRANVEALADELAALGPDNESRERWYWPLVAGFKLFVRVEFPAMWREIYLERGRYGMTREWIEKMSARFGDES